MSNKHVLRKPKVPLGSFYDFFLFHKLYRISNYLLIQRNKKVEAQHKRNYEDICKHVNIEQIKICWVVKKKKPFKFTLYTSENL